MGEQFLPDWAEQTLGALLFLLILLDILKPVRYRRQDSATRLHSTG